MNVYPEFPEDRLNDIKRQAELRVYRELEASGATGTAIYEARPDRHCREVDFAIWLEGTGRFALQVKGGHYRIDRGRWYLSTPTGEETVSTPAKQCWDAALQLHGFLQERISDGHRNPFIVPVLAFPDVDETEEIEAWAGQAGVHVLFGVERLVERLEALQTRVYFPPTAAEIAEEVALVMPGMADPEPTAPAALDLQVRQVVIQHADLVTITTSTAE